jgi:hypothetical protein
VNIDRHKQRRDQAKASLDTPGGAAQIPAGDGMEVDDGSKYDEPVAAAFLAAAVQGIYTILKLLIATRDNIFS